MFYLLFLLVAKLVCPVIASPYEAYPVSQQKPPVARLGKRFQLQISNDTFKSSNGANIVYTAVDLPQWLTWDTDSRSLSGLCPTDFLGGEETKPFSFTLQGMDTSDQVSINASYQLMATSRSPVQVDPSFNLLDLLKHSGETNGKNALKLSQGERFSVVFSKDVFLPADESHPITTFYGRSTPYHSSLPSWINFDPHNLNFSGTAPAVNSELAAELNFLFSLIGTDFDGYSGAEISFMINVGARKFTTNLSNTLVINVTDSGSFNYSVPLNYVFLDNTAVQKEQVTVTLQDHPSWVNLEDNNLVGTLPHDLSEANITVAVHDTYSDIVYLDFTIKSTQRIFATNTLPDFNATRGKWFQYSLSPSQFTTFEDTVIEPSYSGAGWLHYSKSNLTFSGVVPNDFDSVAITVKATKAGIEESSSFKVIGVDNSSFSFSAFSSVSSSTSSTSSSTLSSSSTSLVSSSTTAPASLSSTAAPYHTKKNNLSRTVVIACGVSIPLAVLLFLLLLLLMYLKNSKSKKDDSIEDIEHSPKVISGPRLGNRANNPNPFADGSRMKSTTPEKPVNPFSDENSIESAKKLAVLNAMYLEERSSPNSTDDEKDEQRISTEKRNGDSDLYQDAMDDTDNVSLSATDRNDSVFFTGDPKISTVYYNSEPSKRKSWRYSSHMSKHAAAGNRDSEATRESYVSIQTVSTADLLNTEIAPNKDLKQDPKKSTLGPRDSVFMQNPNKHTSEKSQSSLPVLEPLQEVSGKADTSVGDSTLRLSSSSGGSDFIPVKQGETYQFTPKKSRPSTPDGTEPKSARSVKRLVNLPNKGGVNVSDAALIGQEPERD